MTRIMTVVSQLKAVCFGWILFITALVGVLFFGGGCLPVLLFSPPLYRVLFDVAIAAWEWLAVGLVEKLLGLRVVITGDRLQPNEQSVIIMNHRTCLDWMYFWSVLARQSGVANEKIVLKSPLKRVPGAGWAMQTAAFLFLKRRWDDDEAYLNKMLNYYRDLKYKTQILFFPEGTDLNAKTRASSNSFAAKQGLAQYKHVLHPRTTGFTYLVKYMKQNWPIEAYLYDVTIAYPADSIPQNERELLAGKLPSVAHFHIKRYPISSLPDEPEKLDEWCRDIWTDKEKSLETFTRTNSLLSEKNQPVTGSVCDDEIVDSSGLDSTETNEEGFEIIGKPLHDINEVKSEVQQADVVQVSSPCSFQSGNLSCDVDHCFSTCCHVAIIGWILFVIFYLFLLWWSLFFRLVSLFHVAFFVVMDLKFGGFEIYQAELLARSVKKSL